MHDKVTVMGAAIGAGPSGTTLDVQDAKFFYDKKAVTINSDESFAGGGVFGGGGHGGSDVSLKLRSTDQQGNLIPPTPAGWATYLNGRAFQASDFLLLDTAGNPVPSNSMTQSQAAAFETAFTLLPGDTNFQLAVGQVSDAANAATSTKITRGNYNLDLNQFFKPSDQLHIVYCRAL